MPRPSHPATPDRAETADRHGAMPLRWRSPIVLTLLAAGALERTVWNLLRDRWSAGGEAFLVAMSVGEGRGFSSAYGAGHGATAHLLPISPSIAGAVYALFGYSAAAEVILATWSIWLALGSYLLLDRAFARLGAPYNARLMAFAFLCLAPTYIAQEAVDFRVWEGALAAFLSAMMIGQLIAADGDPVARRHTTAVITIAPILFFVQPLLGAAAFLSLAIVWAGRVRWSVFLRRMTIPSLVLVLVLGGWALRNQIVLGAPVLLRSNAGLELAIANYPGVTTIEDREAAFTARLQAIHPLQGRAAYAAMVAAGGEVNYSRALGREALSWMSRHPGEAATMMATHVGDTIAPGAWIFRIWGSDELAPIQSWLASLAGMLGIAGLFAGVMLGGRRWVFVALPVVTPILLFAPFQPVMRYTYLTYAPLVFCAACGLALVIQRRRPHAATDQVAGASGSTMPGRLS